MLGLPIGDEQTPLVEKSRNAVIGADSPLVEPDAYVHQQMAIRCWVAAPHDSVQRICRSYQACATVDSRHAGSYPALPGLHHISQQYRQRLSRPVDGLIDHQDVPVLHIMSNCACRCVQDGLLESAQLRFGRERQLESIPVCTDDVVDIFGDQDPKDSGFRKFSIIVAVPRSHGACSMHQEQPKFNITPSNQ